MAYVDACYVLWMLLTESRCHPKERALDLRLKMQC